MSDITSKAKPGQYLTFQLMAEQYGVAIETVREINQFGEISSNMNIEKINEFLDKNVDDKKLAERDDYDTLKKGKKSKKKED